MVEAEAPGWRRQPLTRALRPFDQDRVAVPEQSLPVEVGRLLGKTTPEAAEMEDRPPASGRPVNQRVGGTGRRPRDAEPSQRLPPTLAQHRRPPPARLRAEAHAVLLVAQNLQSSLAVAERVYGLDRGRIVPAGDARALRDDGAHRAELLGL